MYCSLSHHLPSYHLRAYLWLSILVSELLAV
jgi:hypothetical protein